MTVATEEMFATGLPSKNSQTDSMSIDFSKMNLSDLMLFSVLPMETNNLRFV